MGRVESEKFEPTEEMGNEFDEAAQLGSAGQLIEKLREHHPTSSALSGGDVDAAWEDADVGEESVGGGHPTPDQDIVEEMGKAVGLTYSAEQVICRAGVVDAFLSERRQLPERYLIEHGTRCSRATPTDAAFWRHTIRGVSLQPDEVCNFI